MHYTATLGVDEPMRRAIEKYGRITLQCPENPNVFSQLCRSIIGQQVSVKAADSIYGKFVSRCSATPETLDSSHVNLLDFDELRSAGLSRSKVLSVQDLAKKMANREIPEYSELVALESDQVINVLSSVRGIGRWTAEMFLMFTMGREDILATGDLGLKKGFSILYDRPDLPSPDEFEKHGELWRPFRTYACMYLWKICHDGSKP